ncbi:XkdF-like putative serine protease domain-containing protein [Paracoccaceae bacterium GXU_MW_L88]
MGNLTDLTVDFISLVKKPATGKSLTLKDANAARVEPFKIEKADDERMVAYGIVYAPDQVDSHGDSADETTIRRAAYAFMREGRLKNIDTEHSFRNEVAFIAESWLVRKGDELFPDEPEGSWAVGIQIGDPDLWKQVKSGELTGISLAGTARVAAETATFIRAEDDETPGWFKRLLSKFSEQTKETPEMDEETLRNVVRSEIAAALKGEDGNGDGGTDDGTPPTDTPAAEQAGAADLTDAVEKAVKAAVGNMEKSLEKKLVTALAKGREVHGGGAIDEEGSIL